GAVDERLSPHRPLDGGAYEWCLLRPGEHGAGDRVVGQRDRIAHVRVAVLHLEQVVADLQATDHTLEAVAYLLQRGVEAPAVEPELELVAQARRGSHVDARIA